MALNCVIYPQKNNKCVAAGRAIKISLSLERRPQRKLRANRDLTHERRCCFRATTVTSRDEWSYKLTVESSTTETRITSHFPPKNGKCRVSKTAESFQRAVFFLPPDQRWRQRLKGGHDWRTEVCKFIAGGEQDDQPINTRPKRQGNVAKKKEKEKKGISKSTQIINQKHWRFHGALLLAEGMWSWDAWPSISNHRVSNENKGE